MNFSEDYIKDNIKYERIFENNQKFIQERLALDPEYFTKLSQGQTPKYLIIGCSDSRVPPNEITKLQPGEIFNHRNIANLVIPADLNVNAVIQYAVDHLKVKHVIVMGHTKCGGVRAAIDGSSLGGMLDLWLSHLKNVYDKYEEELDDIEDLDQKVNKLTELNVIEQVVNIWKNPYIQKSWKKGHAVWVHGWIFRVETGVLDEIVVDKTMPHAMKTHMFNFDDDHNLIRKSSVFRKKPTEEDGVSRRHSVFRKQYEDENDSKIQSNIQSEDIDGESRRGSVFRNQAVDNDDSCKLNKINETPLAQIEEIENQNKPHVWAFDNFLHLQKELMSSQQFQRENFLEGSIVINQQKVIIHKSQTIMEEEKEQQL